MKRLIIFLGLLVATTAVAETDGFFVGGQLGYNNASSKEKYSGYVNEEVAIDGQTTFNESYSSDSSKIGFGVLAGYKQFFTDKFGVRYYGLFNYTKYPAIPAYNINANVDALYNFANVDSIEFGAFGGLSLGYSIYDSPTYVFGVRNTDNIKGFDLGINLGLKAQIAENHGVELYSRFGLLEAKQDINAYDPVIGGGTLTQKIKQPYQIGIRYTFSF